MIKLLDHRPIKDLSLTKNERALTQLASQRDGSVRTPTSATLATPVPAATPLTPGQTPRSTHDHPELAATLLRNPGDVGLRKAPILPPHLRWGCYMFQDQTTKSRHMAW